MTKKRHTIIRTIPYTALAVSLCFNIYQAFNNENIGALTTHHSNPHQHTESNATNSIKPVKNSNIHKNYTHRNNTHTDESLIFPEAIRIDVTQSEKQYPITPQSYSSETPSEIVARVFSQNPESFAEFERMNERRKKIREAMRAGLSVKELQVSTPSNIEWEEVQYLIDTVKYPDNMVDIENQFYQTETQWEEDDLLEQLPEWMKDQTEIINTVSQLNPEDQQIFYEKFNEKLSNWH